jgi:hypothetical protein
MTHSGHGHRATLALPVPSPRTHPWGVLRVEQLCQTGQMTSLRAYALNGKGKSVSDVEKEIDELQSKLTAESRESAPPALAPFCAAFRCSSTG